MEGTFPLPSYAHTSEEMAWGTWHKFAFIWGFLAPDEHQFQKGLDSVGSSHLDVYVLRSSAHHVIRNIIHLAMVQHKYTETAWFLITPELISPPETYYCQLELSGNILLIFKKNSQSILWKGLVHPWSRADTCKSTTENLRMCFSNRLTRI